MTQQRHLRRLLVCLFVGRLARKAGAFQPLLLSAGHKQTSDVGGVQSSCVQSTLPMVTATARKQSPLFGSHHNQNHHHDHQYRHHPDQDEQQQSTMVSTKSSILGLFRKRLDTLSAAGIHHARIAGPLSRIKQIHNPITYLVLAALAGMRWDWCFRNPYYWFAVAFCVKWYRARYVFKIPVWDRQPNWNNIITSKEQEKDLKAFTCKKCGSTLFIAKTREFFFEGNTGIGGLGCFTCGAKGRENFVMDRDRIVEDVADMDDYFEYERPLDFVSRAERRKILKEAQGDEEKANQLLLERQQRQEQQGTDNPSAADSNAIDTDSQVVVDDDDIDVDESATEVKEITSTTSSEQSLNGSDHHPTEETKAEAAVKPKKTKKKKEKAATPKPVPPPPPPPPTNDDDIFDALGMDD